MPEILTKKLRFSAFCEYLHFSLSLT